MLPLGHRAVYPELLHADQMGQWPCLKQPQPYFLLPILLQGFYQVPLQSEAPAEEVMPV